MLAAPAAAMLRCATGVGAVAVTRRVQPRAEAPPSPTHRDTRLAPAHCRTADSVQNSDTHTNKRTPPANACHYSPTHFHAPRLTPPTPICPHALAALPWRVDTVCPPFGGLLGNRPTDPPDKSSAVGTGS